MSGQHGGEGSGGEGRAGLGERGRKKKIKTETENPKDRN